ncbi:hypothetical protein N9C75_05135 [Alphaproteobacteria bacterium]|nr:hypothetical protein [Alphaproteobacteria bacterium]
MVTIFGSRFELYGYLPALIKGLHEQECLPRKYLNAVRSRLDLSSLEEKVFWVDGEDEAIKRSSKVVVSVNPMQQFGIVRRCVLLGFKGHFFLEKPLAEAPEESDKLLDFINETDVGYSIGYSFLYTEELKTFLSNNLDTVQVILNWEFMAHHFAKNLANWKRLKMEDGDVLRFYGIHVIALFAEFGYSDVVSSKLAGEKEEEPSRWKIILYHSTAANCKVIVDKLFRKFYFFIEGQGRQHCVNSD